MSASPEIISPQNVAEIAPCWNGMHLVRKDSGKGFLAAKLLSGDASSSSDELNTKVRKPYTITKQRERWTESEHQKFLEALKLYGRAWRRIEEYIGTKTAVQIRSHAQKFFCKLEREASTGSSAGKLTEIAIPPPRPKRKPSHPYPKKAGNSILSLEDESKEVSSLSTPAGIAVASPEGFQLGSFKPPLNGGLGSGTAACTQSSAVQRNLVGSQGSVKIFGKMVVVPRADQPGCHGNLSNSRLVSKDDMSLGKQSHVTALKQTVGFSPFVKDRKSVNSCPEAHVSLRQNEFHSGAIQAEGTSESLERACCYGSVGVDTEDAGSLDSNNEERKVRNEVGLTKVESGSLTVDMNSGEKVDSQVVNPILQSWMNNYHRRASIPPILANGALEGAPDSSLRYWQLMQASAVNYAAYTAAVAAAAAAGWKASNTQGSDSIEPVNRNMNGKQLPSMPAWWPYRGFIPSVYVPPGLPHQGENSDACEYAKLLGKEKQIDLFKGSASQQDQPNAKARSAGEEKIIEPALDMDCEDHGKDHTRIMSIQCGKRVETSCITEASGSAEDAPDSESQHDVDVMESSGKYPAPGSVTEGRSNLPQNGYSSCDDEQCKKQGGGSSSGSNTPLSRSQSSDCDVPIIPETKKRDSYSLAEDNDDSFGEPSLNCQQQCVMNTVGFPKLRVKHVEKSRKHQQRDLKPGGDDFKRLKSCAHDLEFRKEVSEEGRKAFQALFASKLLPQMFPIANLEGSGDIHLKHDYISKPTVSKNEPRLNESISSTGLPHWKEHVDGKNTKNPACFVMGNNFQGRNEQSPATGKSFTISSSSGFVPYRRPVCSEPMKMDLPLSL